MPIYRRGKIASFKTSYSGVGSPGPLVYPVSNVAMENPMEINGGFFVGKTMGKLRKIHCQWRFEWENHGKI